MNIIIIGAGEIGRHLAGSLSSAAHSIVVIEQDETVAADLGNQIDARVLCGNGASVDTLVDANVGECELFLALTSSNNSNLVSCSVAKALGAKKTICRVDPALQREEWLFDHCGHFNIDHLFSSERLAGIELAKFVRNPESITVDEIARGRIEIQQIIVSDRSDGVGKSLRDLKLPARVRIGSISRKDEAIIPNAEEELLAGDLVTLFGEPRQLTDIVERLQHGAGQKEKKINVVILGGGEYGESLAVMLQSWNCRVRIFEQDPVLCEALTNRLADTTVINADATSIAELREEQVGDADFFVATTQSDQDNVMTCLQAHNLGTKRCLTLIHRTDYADAISQAGAQLGIMAAVSPREVTRRELMRFITSDKYHVVKKLKAGEVIEVTLDEKSKIVDKQVNEIEWPEGSGLVALLHGIHATVPAAEDKFAIGDTIYAIVSRKARKKFLKLC